MADKRRKPKYINTTKQTRSTKLVAAKNYEQREAEAVGDALEAALRAAKRGFQAKSDTPAKVRVYERIRALTPSTIAAGRRERREAQVRLEGGISELQLLWSEHATRFRPIEIIEARLTELKACAGWQAKRGE